MGGQPVGYFLFNEYVLTTYHGPDSVPGTVPSTGATAADRADQGPCLCGAYILVEGWARGRQ